MLKPSTTKTLRGEGKNRNSRFEKLLQPSGGVLGLENQLTGSGNRDKPCRCNRVTCLGETRLVLKTLPTLRRRLKGNTCQKKASIRSSSGYVRLECMLRTMLRLATPLR